MMAPSKDAKNRLIVEGNDDLHTICNLVMRYRGDGFWDSGNDNIPKIEERKSVEQVLDVTSLDTVLKTYVKVGIVIDADTDASNADRWEQVVGLLRHLGILSANGLLEPNSEGTIVDVSRTTRYKTSQLGIWLMPDNSTPGTLEDFLSGLVPSNDCCWDYSKDAVNEAKKLGAKFRDVDFTKSRLHTWLAWQETPGVPYGTAIKARFLGSDSISARNFMKWFEQLFDFKSSIIDERERTKDDA
jgi:hypothetical protein